ncbi:hypothetical protein [Flavobacterium sp.]|nr:hypothetical protein [Flavobacterium sp.]
MTIFRIGSWQVCVGIIKGIATYFNETHAIRIIPMTNPDKERVQIRIEFD